MINVAVLDDYQNVFKQIIDVKKYREKYNFIVFNEPFNDENEAIEALKKFDALFLMRERFKITESLISSLPKLKFIMTSGMRNNSIDLESVQKKEYRFVVQKLILIQQQR